MENYICVHLFSWKAARFSDSYWNSFQQHESGPNKREGLFDPSVFSVV